ncbi:hypothetical protein [Acinetobacter terrestris]|uniref:Uncharacterized protein n=1 Tax=Acinetobacter terrestris TaxID=2529843 RepID=A0AAW6UUB2_9GAMM|nr:hypothetical protein [Acinetobacter terrestris]MDK1684345.1 hypothetical protein [Acinetobacter terrestris]
MLEEKNKCKKRKGKAEKKNSRNQPKRSAVAWIPVFIPAAAGRV